MVSTINLVPHTALTFDSTVLMRDDGIFLAIKKGLGEVPMVRGVDTIIPGLAGRIPRSRVADRMALELEGIVGGQADESDNDPSEIQSYAALVLELVTLFDPTKDPAELSTVMPDGSTWSINVRVVPPLLWDETILGRLARLNVAMESVDPTWTITAAP